MGKIINNLFHRSVMDCGSMRLPKHILMEMVPGTNRQGRYGKMISLLAAPSSRLIGMLRIGTDGLILFMQPTSFGTRCKDR